jgi:hypothetical protein|tara:strand:+ start:375 stop:719 length:345 start_codon:yes stop_codon:yes gene_type:complete
MSTVSIKIVTKHGDRIEKKRYHGGWLCNKDVTVNVQPDDTCYIVKKDLFKDEYYVECLGRGCVDSPLKDMYDSFEALPKWMQEKIAKLVVINQKTEVPHIGVTMTQGLSWIIKN